jgi:hypothetical protein
MTDDPTAAFVTPARTHPTMTAPTDTLTCDTVRAALVDLLTIGQHHHAATPATLTAVGDTRRALAQQHETQDPTTHIAHDYRRLTALADALDVVSGALAVIPQPRFPDDAGLRDGLTELAAVALGWLDVLPNQAKSNPDNEPS